MVRALYFRRGEGDAGEGDRAAEHRAQREGLGRDMNAQPRREGRGDGHRERRRDDGLQVDKHAHHARRHARQRPRVARVRKGRRHEENVRERAEHPRRRVRHVPHRRRGADGQREEGARPESPAHHGRSAVLQHRIAREGEVQPVRRAVDHDEQVAHEVRAAEPHALGPHHQQQPREREAHALHEAGGAAVRAQGARRRAW
jgi:hypothetical protein